MNTKALLVLLAFGSWTLVSWQWYTCEINGFCDDENDSVQVEQEQVVYGNPEWDGKESSFAKASTSAKASVDESEDEIESAGELNVEESIPVEPSEADLATERLSSMLPFSFTFMYDSPRTFFRQKSVDELEDLCIDLTLANRELLLVGHTDTKGERRGGYELGMKRAEVVRKKLIECGCPFELIVTESRGSEDPVAGTNSVNDRAKNRRVEISMNIE